MRAFALFFFAEQSHERSESPTLKRRHDGDGVGSGGSGVYCEAESGFCVEWSRAIASGTRQVRGQFLRQQSEVKT